MYFETVLLDHHATFFLSFPFFNPSIPLSLPSLPFSQPQRCTRDVSGVHPDWNDPHAWRAFHQTTSWLECNCLHTPPDFTLTPTQCIVSTSPDLLYWRTSFPINAHVHRFLAVLAVCEHCLCTHTHLCTLPSKYSWFETRSGGLRSQNCAGVLNNLLVIFLFVSPDGRWHSAVPKALWPWPWTTTTRTYLCWGLPHLYSWPPEWLLCSHNGQDGCVCAKPLLWLVCQGTFFPLHLSVSSFSHFHSLPSLLLLLPPLFPLLPSLFPPLSPFSPSTLEVVRCVLKLVTYFSSTSSCRLSSSVMCFSWTFWVLHLS